MGKGDKGRSFTPPAADFRKRTGNFNAKVGRKENKETERVAIEKKQEPLPYTRILLWLAIFGAVCGLLYAYLTYVLADDDDVLPAVDIPKAKQAAATPTPAAASGGASDAG